MAVLALVMAGPSALASGPVVVKPAGADNAIVDSDNSIIGAHNSPVLAQNPVRPANLVLADRVDLPAYGATVHISADGGHTWKPSALPLPGGPAEKLYAAHAAFDARGTLFVLFVTLSGPGNGPDSLWVTSSGDGGVSYSAPSRVAGADAFQASLAVDARSGRLFATWLQADAEASACVLCFGKTGLPIVVSRSDDHGVTWSMPATISEGRDRVGAPVMQVDDAGNPIMVYVDFRSDQVDWQNLEGMANSNWSMVLVRSGDQGRSFGAGQVVDAEVVAPYRFLMYLPPRPTLAVRGSTVMMAWTDGRFDRPAVLARRSADRGTTWTAASRINNTASAQDLPAITIAGDRVDALYYQAGSSGPNVDVHLASSTDGGRRFTRVVRVSTKASDRSVGPRFTDRQPDADFGSGIALLADGSTDLAAWTDTRNGTVDTARQDVYFAAVNLSGDSGGHVVALVAGLSVAAGIADVALLLMARKRHVVNADAKFSVAD